MQEEYGDKVEFIVVYIREAHALDGASPRSVGGDHPAVEEPLNEGDADVPEQDTKDDADMEQAPHVLRMRDRLSQDHSEAEFETGLVNGVEFFLLLDLGGNVADECDE